MIGLHAHRVYLIHGRFISNQMFVAETARRPLRYRKVIFADIGKGKSIVLDMHSRRQLMNFSM